MAFRRRKAAYILIAAKRRYHNPLNPLNPLNPHVAGVYNGARQHRHLERSHMPAWETDGNCSNDTLSREISFLNAFLTIEA